MHDPAAALGIATVGVVLFLWPAVALFFGGIPGRREALWLGLIAAASGAIAIGEWMLLGEPPAIALFQGTIAVVAVLTIAAVGLRAGRPTTLAVLLGLWLVAVVVPLGYALFDIVDGPIAAGLGTLDFAGACVLGAIPGTAALAVALVHRRAGLAVATPPRRPRWLLALCALAGILGFVAIGVGAELVIDETTLRLITNALLAALGGAVGWTAAQVANVHRASAAGVVAGAIAGSMVVLPASPWLQPVAVLVLAAIAAVLGHLTTIALKSRPMKAAWAPVAGIGLVPASLGMVGAGIVADGPGLLYSGHSDLVEAQLQGLGVVLVLSFLAMLVLAATVYGIAAKLSRARR